jgi:hypothetical protein
MQYEQRELFLGTTLPNLHISIVKALRTDYKNT